MAAKKVAETYIDTAEMSRISGYAQRTMHVYLKTGKIPGGFQLGAAHNAKWVISEASFYKWIEGLKNREKNA